MKFFDTVQELLGTSRFVLSSYISDMTDADILVRPVPTAHHAAWQLGHLLASEYKMMEGVSPGSSPALSETFLARHSKDGGFASDSEFLGVEEYRKLMAAQREATLAVALQLSDERLGQPAPEFMRSYAPRVSSVFLTIGGHELMHAGQLAVIRRALGKPVLI